MLSTCRSPWSVSWMLSSIRLNLALGNCLWVAVRWWASFLLFRYERRLPAPRCPRRELR